jgi:hypothetical protein
MSDMYYNMQIDTLHALNDCVNLVSSFGTFCLLSIEHDPEFYLLVITSLVLVVYR